MTIGTVVAGTHLAHVLWMDGPVVCWIDRQGFSKLKGTIYWMPFSCCDSKYNVIYNVV